MEAIIRAMVNRFEAGRLSRRDLVQGLTALAAAASVPAAEAQGGGLMGAKVDHVSIQVEDLPRSIAFYRETFGLAQVSEDKPNEIVRLGAGGKVLVSLHHKSPTGLVDHFAIGVEKFDKGTVTKILQARGLTPEENLDAGFHVKDPSGLSVQIVGA
jgi:catechol 2,3-dioxygenase-like lactoylglutathione lyase family enzyme